MRAGWTALLVVVVVVQALLAPDRALPGLAAAEPRPHSLALDGTSAFAEVADAPDLDLTLDWTIELWLKDESPEGYVHSPRVLVTKGDPLFDRQVPYGLLVAFGVL